MNAVSPKKRAAYRHAQALLRETDWTHRMIAAASGISRSTVAKLAKGRVPRYSDEPAPEPDKLVGVCPTCEYRVPLPCVACEARGFIARGGHNVDA